MTDLPVPSRRGVLRGAAAVGAVGALAGPLAACGSSSPGDPAGAPTGAEGDTPTGPITETSEVPVGGGTILLVGGTRVVVTQPEADTFRAFSAICTHEGCSVASVTEDVIFCPCHGSEFDVSTGAVVRGPAQAPLATVPIAVQGSTISFA